MGWFTDGWDKLTDRLESMTCGDGTKRFWLKDPRDLPVIFDQYFVEWKLKVSAALKLTKETAEANVGTEVGKKAQRTHDEISNMDRSAFAKYTMAYNTFTTDPCGNSKFLAEITTTIINQMDKLDAQINNLRKVTEEKPLEALVDSGKDNLE